MTMKQRTLSLFFFTPALAFAMNLKQVFQEAIIRNENVPIQIEAVVQADENVKQAWGNIVPQITGSTQWMWQQQYTGANGALSPSYNPYTKLTASQPLFQGYRDWFGLSQTKKVRGQQESLKDNVELTIYKSIISSYYSVLYLEKDIVNLKEQIHYINDEIKLLQEWKRIGRAQTTDVLTAQSSLATQEVLVEQDISQLKAGRDAFALTTGLPPDTPLDDDAQNFMPSLEPLEAYLDHIKQRPDVKANQNAVMAAQDNISVQKANHVPSVALTADRYFQRAGVQENVNWDASIVLTVPIFAGGVTQSKVRQAYSQSRQADLALSLAERTAQQEVRQYYDTVASDIKQLALNNQNVKVNEANYKEEEHYLRLGLVPYLNVITALTNYIAAKRTLDQNIFNLKGDYAHLVAAIAANKSEL
jgi:outer membrane protein